MDNSKPVGTPAEIGTKLVKAKDEDNLVDLYLSTKTRPDIACAVGNVAYFLSKPIQTHWIAVKRIMRYLNETSDFGLLYLANDNITRLSDADWAEDHDD